uniref:Bifunctional adenosylcobalamin biosynthesis protein n=1 Tax=Magnetococcus massalia (strain MO-1) TaxID=451514 RepID=A0A1S7LGX9_MAGMO|nr:Bifunctional adenosylcobalamin biosynthesis protein cobP [Includes: Adenosylcobinamide kinase; Adenosylcobinamide-phosphate guanylyltransferase] [Candidatus Magnetococcus massalia]
MAVELILGGARSGKSREAEQRARVSGMEVIYIATAQPHDQEMQQRIDHHRRSRPSGWQTIEEPLNLLQTLQQQADSSRLLLVDCLTLWLSNHLMQQENHWSRTKDSLLQHIWSLPGRILLVSNETGLGVIPMGELTRQFVDEAGWLHQALARQADRVTLMVAGLPMELKA